MLHNSNIEVSGMYCSAHEQLYIKTFNRFWLSEAEIVQSTTFLFD